MASTAHKSATSVTIAPLQEKSEFEAFVLKYWKHGAAVAVVVGAAVVVAHQRSQAEKESRAKSWDAVMARTTADPMSQEPQADSETWASLASELKGEDSGPWVRLMQAKQLVADRKFDEAKAALDQLQSEYPKHPLLQVPWQWSDESQSASLLQTIEARIDALGQWEAQHPELFGNPPAPADAPRVVMQTSKGSFTVALYPAKAPLHVAKFLELVESNYFDGGAVYGLSAGRSFSLGDPNSKTEDAATWGEGGGELVLPFEKSGLHHFSGAFCAEEGPTEKESLGGRFSVYVTDSFMDDDSEVVFGVVESGLEIAREIAGAETDPAAPTRTKEPIRILGATRQ